MVKILVADDSMVIRKMVKKILSKIECEIVEAEDGKIAHLEFNKGGFNLVITDINMPGMTGLELSRLIREGNENPQVPIIVLSTEFSDNVKNEGREIGVNAWMVKPCDEGKLLALTEKFTGAA